jgi:prepilin-type N-terminal cleavage/methylation domain-containing protein
MRRARSQRGFTLIELMTVIAIISIITVSLASMSSTPGKGTPQTVSDQVVGIFQFARLRAEARRTTHRVQVTATTIAVFENTTKGFTTFNTLTPIFVQQLEIPTGVVMWASEPTLRATATGAIPTQNAGFPFNIDFKVDGQSTGGTVFLTDHNQQSKYRIFVYRTTGSTMARENW